MSDKKTSELVNVPFQYSLAPLREAVVEIRFPGNPAIECHRDTFFEHIKSDFPDVSTPVPAVPLPPYRFQSLDGKRSVISSINMLAYTTLEYKHFVEFREHVLPVANFFTDTFKITTLKRFGMRYVNRFPLAREGTKLPLKNLLKVDFVLPSPAGSDFSDFAFAAETKLGSGAMITRIQAGKENNQDVISLDFDYYITENLIAVDVPKYIEDGHKNIKLFFEAMVTDSYKKVMRGEVLK
ncbi:MAG: TIGR04255 family protein [Elusimicrobia bacterium]|nr:TIGR04255 family protein [Elusimicrobiota bacterium]